MQRQHGYIALSSILIISVVVFATILSITLLSIGEARSGLALEKGEGALAFVEGCTEDALLKSRENVAYNGGTITRPEGTCTVALDSKVGTTWTLTVSTVDTKYKRSIQVQFDRSPTGITLTTWKEIE